MLQDAELQKLVDQYVIEKINAIIAKECENYGIIGTNTELRHLGRYIFAVSHTKIKTSKMHRYNLFCFTDSGITLLYLDGNVIDADKFKTIEDVIKNTKGFFSFHSNELNKI